MTDTTTNKPTAPVKRKATAVLGWFPTTPATEQSVLDMANSRQVALRTRLRHHYWLTDCKPITETTVQLARRKLVSIDARDETTQTEVDELLSAHYGFEVVDGGWSIPDLNEAHGAALSSIKVISERASVAGMASAAARSAPKPSTPTPTPIDEEF